LYFIRANVLNLVCNYCECRSGEVDPCVDAQCDVNADCIAHETTYQCVCKSGYEGTGRRCQGLFVLLSIIVLCLINAKNKIIIFIVFWPATMWTWTNVQCQ